MLSAGILSIFLEVDEERKRLSVQICSISDMKRNRRQTLAEVTSVFSTAFGSSLYSRTVKRLQALGCEQNKTPLGPEIKLRDVVIVVKNYTGLLTIIDLTLYSVMKR